MDKIQKKYDLTIKKKAVDLYFKQGMGYKTVAKELGIDLSAIRRWVNWFKAEGIKGLEDKRGKTKGTGIGRPRISPEDPETEIKRLKAENELLKKLLKK